MSQSSKILVTLKKALRRQQVTYADVAVHLEMSEANVKRMFASEKITLERLEAICQLLQMELRDLFELYQESRECISELTLEQEKELIADPVLLLVAVAVRNHQSFQDILQHYHIEAHELIQRLAQLDRLKIIDLLPGNRIRLRIAENFRWLPHGPIETYFQKEVQKEFLQDGFDCSQNSRQFLFGLLSDSSQQIILKRLQSLSEEFTQLHRQDSQLPLEQRHSIGLLVAMREWEYSLLRPYVKQPLKP